ncbi:MAG: GDP-mannose 4,6-dehydratase, partial [Acetatifactor sp.]|nr:GDP-mannose 4,6-dehydratase [Acetatifactor sp.]
MNLENKAVLVTGAAGFIGGNLVPALLKKYPSIHIIGIDNLNDYYDVSLKEFRLEQIEETARAHTDIKWTFVRGSIDDRALVK